MRPLLFALLLLLPVPLFAVPVLLSTGGTATGTSQGFGSVFGDGIDGNRDGTFANGSVWHTNSPDTANPLLSPPPAVAGAPVYEVNLGGMFYLDRVMIWPRTDISQGTLTKFSLKVFDDTDAPVFAANYLAAESAKWPWGTTALRGVRGRKVRLERLDTSPNFLTFAEFEVWGSATLLPENLALNQPVSAPGGGAFSTSLTAGNDGVIDNDFAHAAKPLFYSNTMAVGQNWTVDLGAMKAVDYVQLFNRGDFNTTPQAKLSLRDTAGGEVWSQVLDLSNTTKVRQGQQFDVVVDVPGFINARYVRLETTQATYLAFAELEVFGPAVDTTPPRVGSTDPPAGSLLGALDQVEVVFDEDVTGVDAADLRINGAPAVRITPLTPRRLLFGFPQPSAGTITFSWAVGGITDLAGNALASASWTVTLEPALPAPRVFISEFLTVNKGGLHDADDDSPDWIEITNPGPTPVNLAGWSLTDRPAVLGKWTFPSTILLPAQPLVVFASGKNRAVPGGELHTNFKLDSDGGALLLVKPDGVTVVSRIDYGPQAKNISSGRGRTLAGQPLLPAGAAGRLLVPTGPVAGWTTPEFLDTAWTSVTTGVGYDVSNGQGAGGPLGYWNFNNSASATTATDASGNNRPGTITSATYTANAGGRTGLPGDRAIRFTGNGVVSIAAAQTGAFDAIATRNAVTVSLWIFGDAAQPAQNFLFWAGSDSAGGGTRQLNAHLPWSDSVIYWDTGGCCEEGRTRVSIGEPNPANYKGRWNHYAFVKNEDTKEIWQNGQRVLSAINTTPMGPFRSLFLGAMSATGSGGYRGMVDDFALWDGALSAAQIQALASGSPPLEIRRLTPLIATDTAALMRNANASALLRLPFTLTGPALPDTLVLRIQYDDGFTAWLNGVEVARRQAPANLSWNSTATARRAPGSALLAEDIELSTFAPLLRPGVNVLAIQGLNATAADPEFLLRPVLLGGSSAEGRFFPVPTPGALNSTGYTGLVGDTSFAPRRGFYDAPFNVTITCVTPGAHIAVTTDGSEPAAASAVLGPVIIPIARTTTLRARAFSGTLAPSNIDTHTYLFLDQVGAQVKPASAASWGGAAPDFEMDARITTGQPPGYTLRDSLTALPSLSLTADPSGLWGSNGIYVQSSGRGRDYERPASAEWLIPGGVEGFHVSAGLRIHGNISRDKGFTPKHSFTLKFRSDYGDPKLDYPIFPDATTSQFDSLVLRAGSTDTWPCTEWDAVGLGLNGEPYQRWARPWASYIRDQWARDTHLAMGQPAAHGRFCHLYLNGIYWGLYNVTEELGQDMLASQLGGNAADWDVMADFNELFDGQRTAWDQLLALAGAGLSTNASVRHLLGKNPDGSPDPAFPALLDLDSLIDYFILHIYIGADDWPNHNWYAARNSRSAMPQGFQFLTWDQEISNENVLYGRSAWGPVYAEANAAGTSSAIYVALRANAEFRLRFADRIQKHLFNGGALTQPANLARWSALKAGIDRALVAESARWGDARRPAQPYRREVEWLQHMAWMDRYWNQIPATALQRFTTAGLYPAVKAPVPGRPNGPVNPGATLTLANPNPAGSLLFTLDGTDPRLSGGTPSPTAPLYASAIPVSPGTVVQARILKDGVWSALHVSSFTAPTDADADGLPDAWETAHALNPANPADALADPDADGQSSLAEYAAGTDPNDPASRFTCRAIADSSAGVRLTFDAAPGRQFTLQSTRDLSTSPWITRTIIPATAAARRLEITLPQTQEREFYRISATIP